MKKRPGGFLSEEHIDHSSEAFDYIRELHEYLWRFVRATLSPGASGSLGEYLDKAIKQAEMRQLLSLLREMADGDLGEDESNVRLLYCLEVLGMDYQTASRVVRGGCKDD